MSKESLAKFSDVSLYNASNRDICLLTDYDNLKDLTAMSIADNQKKSLPVFWGGKVMAVEKTEPSDIEAALNTKDFLVNADFSQQSATHKKVTNLGVPNYFQDALNGILPFVSTNSYLNFNNASVFINMKKISENTFPFLFKNYDVGINVFRASHDIPSYDKLKKSSPFLSNDIVASVIVYRSGKLEIKDLFFDGKSINEIIPTIAN